MTTVTRTVDFAVKGKRKCERAAEKPQGRVPRISKLMALAIRYDRMLSDGVVQSQTELAELLHVSQPRMTQIMNLLHLAPEIQEELLMLSPAVIGTSELHERSMRSIVRELSWRSQVRLYRDEIMNQPGRGVILDP